MMKAILAATLVGVAAGFQPAVPMVRRAAVLTMASTVSPKSSSSDDWSNKPLFERKSTKPEPVRQVSKRERERLADVMIEPNYFLTWAVALLGPLIWWYHPTYELDGSPSLIGIFGGGFHVLFAALLWVQTRRVRCVFEKDAFEFYNIKGPGLDLEKGAWLEKKPANYVSGTRNRWKYDTITNYAFFPSLEFPVICYFKETETPKEQWNQWFAAFDSYGRGQPHFFPGICDARQFKEQCELRGIKRKEIPTLKSRQSKK